MSRSRQFVLLMSVAAVGVACHNAPQAAAPAMPAEHSLSGLAYCNVSDDLGYRYAVSHELFGLFADCARLTQSEFDVEPCARRVTKKVMAEFMAANKLNQRRHQRCGDPDPASFSRAAQRWADPGRIACRLRHREASCGPIGEWRKNVIA